jgi:hypothetical protein
VDVRFRGDSRDGDVAEERGPFVVFGIVYDPSLAGGRVEIWAGKRE